VQGSRRNPLDLRHPGRVFAAVSLSIVVVDQIAKFVARANLVEGQPVIVIANVLHLTRVHNVGAAFGIFPGGQPVFMFTSMLVLIAIALYWRRTRPREWPVVIALAMIAAGGLGNLIDRAVLGQVTDFFEFGFVSFPVFNVADMGIVCGVIVLGGWFLFGPTEEDPDAQAAELADSDAGTSPGGTASQDAS
jgi:signal peptidase II